MSWWYNDVIMCEVCACHWRPWAEPQDWLKQGVGSAQEKIVFADEQLMATAGAKINTTGDVILTFAASSIVLAALLQAHQVHHH